MPVHEAADGMPVEANRDARPLPVVRSLGDLKVDADTNGVGSAVSPATVPQISADGRYVAFECLDGSLVPYDRNHDYDVFVRDLGAGTSELISARDPTLPSLRRIWEIACPTLARVSVPPVAGCSPAAAMARPVSTLQAIDESSSAPCAFRVIFAAAGSLR